MKHDAKEGVANAPVLAAEEPKVPRRYRYGGEVAADIHNGELVQKKPNDGRNCEVKCAHGGGCVA
jgi:hypothetical protein